MALTAPSSRPEPARLRITEIFLSLQGEVRSVGVPTVFVRLTGCPLRCAYCDTAYAFSGGQWMDLDQIKARVEGFGVTHVCVTGGEPLAQPGTFELLSRLCDAGFEVSLETSGAIDIGGVDPRVSRVLDIKTPGSGEVERNRYENITLLTAHDQVKFVICHREDFEWSCHQVQSHELAQRCEVFFSPSHDELEARELAEWILELRLPVRLQIQIHKYLWGKEPGR